jgi:ferrous iron transport protein B
MSPQAPLTNAQPGTTAGLSLPDGAIAPGAGGLVSKPEPLRPLKKSEPYIALTGNPNCGKTTVFNALTGLRAKVGNYAGVTVERKEGKLLHAPPHIKAHILDLPGTYSLSPQSLDEQISRDVLLNRLDEIPAPAAIVVVVDASNLQRNLYYATQVIELAYPTVLALNMMDVAEQNGHCIDVPKLQQILGIPVVPLVASTGKGLPELRGVLIELLEGADAATPQRFCKLPDILEREAEALAVSLAETFHERRAQAAAEALLLLGSERALASSRQHYPAGIEQAVGEARQRLEKAGIDWRGAVIEGRYAQVSAIQQTVSTTESRPGDTFSDRLDRILTHRLWGTAIFLILMALMFQSIFTLAHWPMEALQAGIDWLGGTVATLIPRGDLNSLLVDGVIAGVGAVVIFLPQILLLFLFIGFLEDTGYMARAAFLMDRLMSKVGLHGKSFIPMLSSFACAVPGIMATRTIESPKDRLVTILVSPLMSCSARLPVYTLLIAACIPNVTVLGFAKLQGLTMLCMYLLGVLGALTVAWVLKHTILRGETPLLILELPPYKRPLARVVLRHMWDRSKIFLRQAGTIILGITIMLWFLATYPRNSQERAQYETRRAAIEAAATTPSAAPESVEGARKALVALDNEYAGSVLRDSFAGRLGRAIEPVIAPLGFDWKIGIGIISSFAAREVFVSSMAAVYNLGRSDEGSMSGLAKALAQQRRADGTPMYTMLTGLTLMVFYVFALQCVSTVAIVRRETNSWKWPIFQWLYMGILAWGAAFVTWRLGHVLGFT